MRKIAFTLVAATVLLCSMASFTGCSSIDCPLNSRVYATYKLVGSTEKIVDTLSVSTTISEAEGNDTVLINRVINVDSVSLPMSYSRAEDTFYFTFHSASDTTLCDTVVVAKQDIPHFEAVDCNPAIFHTITGVRYTQNAIDSITINNNTVTYNAEKPHFIVYLKDSSN